MFIYYLFIHEATINNLNKKNAINKFSYFFFFCIHIIIIVMLESTINIINALIIERYCKQLFIIYKYMFVNIKNTYIKTIKIDYI